MWITNKQSKNDYEGLYYFKREFELTDLNTTLSVRVCADTRYKLYCNGSLVSIGPCKGTAYSTYYDTVNLTPYLKAGNNILMAYVLHLDDSAKRYKAIATASMFRTPVTGFLCEGELLSESGLPVVDVSTDEKWLTMKESGYSIVPLDECIYVTLFERIMLNEGYTFNNWEQSEIVCDAHFDGHEFDYGQQVPWILKSRPIPELTYEHKTFAKVIKANNADDYSSVELQIPANTTCSIELDAGEYHTGYMALSSDGGNGAELKITYSECYVGTDGQKNMRDDSSGILSGVYDTIMFNGSKFDYETFWFRAFRFVKLDITTKDQPLNLNNIGYYETNYPLAVNSNFESSDPDAKDMWDVSIRTLKNCMHETYEDCPYYEQLQYVMDSRLQSLFHYCLSNDRVLTKRCIRDFKESQYPDGMIASRYPCIHPQIIPGFSLHYIFMVEDYMNYTDDLSFVKDCFTTIEEILIWWKRHITSIGVVGDTGYWKFLDWVDRWQYGQPGDGPLSCYNFMYAVALKSAANIAKAINKADIANTYDTIRSSIIENCNKIFWDNRKGYYQDTLDKEYSQHSQIWAVLAEAVTGDSAVNLMKRLITDPNLPVCSYSMMFFVFRAFEKVNLYSEAYQYLDNWRMMLQQHCTTWVEDNVTQRSECHGWGSLPIYEFSAVILGVKPNEIGYKSIKIAPKIPKSLSFAKGNVITPSGNVSVSWTMHDNYFTLDVTSPHGIVKEIELPNGEKVTTSKENFTAVCDI